MSRFLGAQGNAICAAPEHWGSGLIADAMNEFHSSAPGTNLELPMLRRIAGLSTEQSLTVNHDLVQMALLMLHCFRIVDG